MTSEPIYIAGLERSGTSLIYALLASHPDIAMTRRTNLWTHFYDQYGDLADDANLDACLDMMVRYRRLIVLDLDRDRLRSDFVAGARTYGRLFDLIECQYADRLGKPRWGDKSLNTERFADAIFEQFPNARIIHMIRDPRDRYASSKTRWKRRRGGIGAGAGEWLGSMRLAQQNLKRHGHGYMILRYEDLAREPEKSLNEVCNFIGEPYDAEMLAMEGATVFRDQGSNSSYGTRKSGVISTDSIGKYRHVLTKPQIAFVDRVARSEMASVGYAGDPASMSGAEAVRFATLTLPAESARLLAWRVRTSIKDRRGRPVPAYRLVDSDSQ